MKEQSALHHASAANHGTSAGERADQDAESSDSAAAFSASAFQHRGSSADIELKHNNFCFSLLSPFPASLLQLPHLTNFKKLDLEFNAKFDLEKRGYELQKLDLVRRRPTRKRTRP